MIICRHFSGPRCAYNDLSIFIKFATSTNIVHDVTLFNDDDQRNEWRFLSSFEKNLDLIINVLFMLDVKLLFLDQSECISFKNNVFQAIVQINFNCFIFFNKDYIFHSFNKHMHVAKINILFRMLDERCRNNSLVIVIKIKEFYIDNISSIAVMNNLRCRKCKRDR